MKPSVLIRNPWQRTIAILASCVLSAPLVAGPIFADEKLSELEGVGITEHLDEQIPLDLMFVDENGENIVLGQ